MTDNIKLVYEPWSEANIVDTPWSWIFPAAEDVNDAFLAIEEGLENTSDMSVMGYKDKVAELATLLSNMQNMADYVDLLPYNIDTLIDNPLYKEFVNEATEGISRIKLEDITTDNIVGLGEEIMTSSGYGENIRISKKANLGFADFLGSALGDSSSSSVTGHGVTVTTTITQTQCVESFANMYSAQYAALVDQELIDGKEVNLQDYLNHMMVQGQFDHKMDKPFLGFVSAVLDATIIVPVISACLGYDIITKEDLSESERAFKVVGALGTCVAVALALPTGGASLTGRQILATVLHIMVSDAAGRGAAYVAGQADLPTWAQIAIGAGVAIIVYKGTDGFFAKIAGEVVPISPEQAAAIEQANGPGNWNKTNEAMSDASRNYQRYITGAEDGMVYTVDGVKFDGFQDGFLIEAKGNYSNFVNKSTGEFHSWFNGKNSLISQANRQLNVANGTPIKWYFNDPVSMEAVKSLLSSYQINGIEFILKPML